MDGASRGSGWARRAPIPRRAGSPPPRRGARRPPARLPANAPPRLQVMPPPERVRETREGDVVHAEDFDTVLVVDFGAQYAQLIARRVRECHVYSEIVPATMPAGEILARRPAAVILSGGPASVYAEGAPPAPAGLLGAGVPVLGICYGFQLMVAELGGTVARTGVGEYGGTALDLLSEPGEAGASAGPGAGGTLLGGLPSPQQVWMSHGDTCTLAPPGFAVTARTAASPVA